MQRMKKKRLESMEGLMRPRGGASSETIIDHNVTPDQEKKVEPVAGSRQDYVAVKLRRYLKEYDCW